MNTKSLRKTMIALLIVFAICIGAAVTAYKTVVFADADDSDVSTVTTTGLSIADLPEGVPQMTYFSRLKEGGAGDSAWVQQAIEEIDVDGETVPGFYVDKKALQTSSNVLLAENPIQGPGPLDEITATLHIYAHLSSGTTYWNEYDNRGVRLYSLNSTGYETGVIIPKNVIQDEWIDYSLTYEEFSTLCDPDGTFRGLKIGSLIRGTEGDIQIYQDGSAFFAVTEVSFAIVSTNERNTYLSSDLQSVGGTAFTSAANVASYGDSQKIYQNITEETVGGADAFKMTVHHKDAYFSSNAVVLNKPIADAIVSVKEVKIRIYAHLWSELYWASDSATARRGVRLFSLDSNGEEEGVLIPRTFVNDHWLDLTLTSAQLSMLCDADGTFRGIKICSLVRSTEMLYSDGAAYIAVGDILVDEKLDQTALVLDEVGDAAYGDTVSLGLAGGSGSGEVTFEILKGSNIVSLDNNRLSFIGLGEVQVRVKKGYDDDYKAAESNTITINVQKYVGNELIWTEEPADTGYSGEAISASVVASRGEAELVFYAWDAAANDWSAEASATAPSARGRYKAVATVEGCDLYDGAVLEKEFYITASVTLGSNLTYTGSLRDGGTLTFTASAPTGQQLVRFEVKTGDGEFVALQGNEYTMTFEDVEVRAVFENVTYRFTSESSVSYEGTLEYGQTITLSVTVPEGMEVDYYTVNGTSLSGNVFVMPAEDVSVEAVFAKITYVITASGSLTYEGIAQMGETITLTAGTAPEGKEFDYFTVDGEKIDGNTFTMPASNVEISVVWKDAVKSGCGSSIAFASSAVSLLCVALVAALAVVKRRVK